MSPYWYSMVMSTIVNGKLPMVFYSYHKPPNSLSVQYACLLACAEVFNLNTCTSSAIWWGLYEVKTLPKGEQSSLFQQSVHYCLISSFSLSFYYFRHGKAGEGIPLQYWVWPWDQSLDLYSLKKMRFLLPFYFSVWCSHVSRPSLCSVISCLLLAIQYWMVGRQARNEDKVHLSVHYPRSQTLPLRNANTQGEPGIFSRESMT